MSLHLVLLSALISTAAASSLSLDTNCEGKEFRFYNYNNQFCMKNNGDAIVVAFDCSDAAAIFTLTENATTFDDNGIQAGFTALKFKHKATGKCLGHDDKGVLGLYACQPCCNTAKTQEWHEFNSWSSYYMIDDNDPGSDSTNPSYSCITAASGVESVGTPIHTVRCDYYDNSQWWSLWQV